MNLLVLKKRKSITSSCYARTCKKKEQRVIHNEIKDIDKQIALLNAKRREAQMKLVATNNNNNNERQSIGRPCPKENCRGFLSSQWKCSVCDMWTCPECHQLKGFTRDAHHTCNPDDVATAKLLNSDTKPCPSCRTPIHKLVGCDQMWCTQCHTGFSWRSALYKHVSIIHTSLNGSVRTMVVLHQEDLAILNVDATLVIPELLCLFQEN